MFKRRAKKVWVSASDVGRAAFCPHYLELKNRCLKPSPKAVSSRIRGNKNHDELNRMAQDKRCYIASYLYGVDDNRTNSLRSFRDQNLLSNRPGTALVAVYYKLSPSLVAISIRYPVVAQLLRLCVNTIVKLLDKRIK